MKLYYSPGACSLSPHIVALELGLDIQTEKVNLREHKTEGGADFYGINPKGYVPTLQLDNGEVLTEGPAIVQWLADMRPEVGLLPPAGTFDRARVQEWLNFIGTEIHKNYSPLFYAATPAEWKENRKQALRGRYALVNKALTGKKYLFGDNFTVADAYLFTVTNWAKNVELDLSDYTAVLDFQKAVAARPAVQAALAAEGVGGAKAKA